MPTPTLAAILLRRRATREAAQAELRQSDDRDFIGGMIHTVSLWYDARAVGSHAGAHPAHPADWQPVTGFDAVACRVVIKRTVPFDSIGRPGSMRVGRVLFPQEIPADQRNSLVFEAATFGTLRLYLIGPVVNAHEMDHHWYADFADRPQ